MAFTYYFLLFVVGSVDLLDEAIAFVLEAVEVAVKPVEEAEVVEMESITEAVKTVEVAIPESVGITMVVLIELTMLEIFSLKKPIGFMSDKLVVLTPVSIELPKLEAQKIITRVVIKPAKPKAIMFLS